MKKNILNNKKRVAFIIVISIITMIFMNITTVNAYGTEKTKLKITAKAAVLIDENTGSIIYEKNSKKHLPPASVTKVMTVLLILEGCDKGKISLKDKVVISDNAASMGGSQMYMEEGETHTVEELLKGVIMASANDGCVALAEHLCGDIETFVREMNSKAKELGLKDSNFVNTNGLPVSNHYSCAYDIGIISKELLKYEYAKKWFTLWQEDVMVGLPGKKKKFTLTNTNKLIKEYNGAIGLKTGFTQDAGYCLSAAAEREETRFIAVVLGCETSDIRFDEASKLLNYGFSNYKTIKLANKNERIKKIKQEKGNVPILYAKAAEDIKICVETGEENKIKQKVKIKNNLKPPIKKGSAIGKMEIYKNGKKVNSYDLIADRNVETADFITLYLRVLKELI